MVKHQKEKLYQSAREHRSFNQQHIGANNNCSSGVRRLPFNCCALTLTPFTSPVCSRDGIVFEASAIIPYLHKHGIDPVSGKPMTSRDLITLHMDKVDQGGIDTNVSISGHDIVWQCPALSKPFTNHTRIVAILQHPPDNEANVYSFQAVQMLNFKSKNYIDLISGKKFHKTRDVITLYDPNDETLNHNRDIDNFVHTKQMRDKLGNGESGSDAAGGSSGLNVRMNVTAQRIMDKLNADNKKRKEEEEKASRKRQKLQEEGLKSSRSSAPTDVVRNHDAIVGKNKVASEMYSGSLTSTSISITNATHLRDSTNDEQSQWRWNAMKSLKKKAYAKIILSNDMGTLNIELHCDIVPRTCENFIGLAQREMYNGSIFHRSIRNFMIQGGKPNKSSTRAKTGEKGKVDIDGEGESMWGDPFLDEFDNRLCHSERGVLSMANSGPNTNRSQFFITFKNCTYLDRKHSVFGRVVGGLEVLDAMEDVPTDSSDKPITAIEIKTVDIVVNPISEAVETEQSRLEEAERVQSNARAARRAAALGQRPKIDSSPVSEKLENLKNGSTFAGPTDGVGKYLTKLAAKGLDDVNSALNTNQTEQTNVMTEKKSKLHDRRPALPRKTVFRDFSGW